MGLLGLTATKCRSSSRTTVSLRPSSLVHASYCCNAACLLLQRKATTIVLVLTYKALPYALTLQCMHNYVSRVGVLNTEQLAGDTCFTYGVVPVAQNWIRFLLLAQYKQPCRLGLSRLFGGCLLTTWRHAWLAASLRPVLVRVSWHCNLDCHISFSVG